MKRWRYRCLVGFVVFLGSSLAAWASKTTGSLFGNGSSGNKNIGIVQRSDLLRQVTVAGTVVPLRRTMITPQYNSYLKKLYVRLGDKIKAGSPVLTLVQSLRDNDEEVYPMRAPFDGTVVQVLKSEGEYLETGKDGNSIVRIDDLTRLFVNSDVPEGDITKIRVGQEVVVKANAVISRSYHGIIREISLAAKEKKEWSRSGDRVDFEVKIEVTDKDQNIRPGMSVIIDIITDKKTQVLALAHEFIERNEGGYYATLESGERRKLDIGLQNDEMFEIIRGLNEHDRVRIVDFIGMNTEK